ncbi:arsenate reductase (glutaredoxin) [Aliiglaciecola sp. CAU 1673]|uniref:arsenate reductase (glutaredoxin) n=1 Tax=Aliiglaciecola sp. CAU 1673 TaxID=3032595 RepID=UPI0023DB8B40|nr:arsenate reductase (glutaredoxin) [Aliiglaciecola sp. CAU 1673]MDF2177561.1 arsenate reductase (glutaredoxin) [Aliiglaciecola sp. CAU 1673]
MSQIQILHNPRCSKSRQTLALIEEKGISPQVVEYLKSPLNKAQLEALRDNLGLASFREMMRTKEDLYKELSLADAGEEQLLEALVLHPVLLERPVVINGKRARIGRPPEQVLEIL